MNIIITSHDNNPLLIGGDKRVSLTLAKEWTLLGNNVTILCSTTHNNRPPEVEGITQIFLPQPIETLSHNNIIFFEKIIKDKSIDIIFHQHAMINEYNWLCAQIANIVPVIGVIHFSITHTIDIISQSFFIKYKSMNNPSYYLKDLYRYIKYLLFTKRHINSSLSRHYKYLADNFNTIALLSETLIPVLENYLSEKNKTPIIAMPNPVILNNNTELCSHKERIVIWCGRLEYDMKRLDRMIEIWRLVEPVHPDWKLIILGGGNLLYWQKIINSYRLNNIELAGFQDSREFFQKASILCMTSTTEGFPMVMVEAQSYGCVPIAFNSFKAIVDIIDNNKTGIYCKPFNKHKYANELSKLMTDDKKRQNMALNAIESVGQYDSKLIAKKWISIFESIDKSY